jgi:hypothetical protein
MYFLQDDRTRYIIAKEIKIQDKTYGLPAFDDKYQLIGFYNSVTLGTMTVPRYTAVNISQITSKNSDILEAMLADLLQKKDISVCTVIGKDVYAASEDALIKALTNNATMTL